MCTKLYESNGIKAPGWMITLEINVAIMIFVGCLEHRIKFVFSWRLSHFLHDSAEFFLKHVTLYYGVTSYFSQTLWMNPSPFKSNSLKIPFKSSSRISPTSPCKKRRRCHFCFSIHILLSVCLANCQTPSQGVFCQLSSSSQTARNSEWKEKIMTKKKHFTLKFS